VELYEQIRREYEHGAGTIRAVARKLGVHRREVRRALASAVPPERKRPERERPKLAPALPFIDAILEADRRAPRKQRHTARRIWMRLRQEKPEMVVGESTVREYVRQRKEAMGLSGHEVFVAQAYQFGGEAQVDWYEIFAEIDGQPRKVYIFCMRSMASGAAFHRAYAHLRWAVMVEGKQGLREWHDAVHIFLAEDEQTAFQQALEIGRQGEDIHTEGRREVETRLAEIIRLDCLGSNQTQFAVSLGSTKTTERQPFDHVFKPEEHMPESAF
jgi:hypothetical protein